MIQDAACVDLVLHTKRLKLNQKISFIIGESGFLALLIGVIQRWDGCVLQATLPVILKYKIQYETKFETRSVSK
ncbi:hypothetical protein [Roseobacter sp. AzwK-3b]|uniref:hypothetical protein n=1 Tax=Roseobacter sp. AzwK-3b TaxID=351016 RepID=UPI0012F4FB35|nr:hypothetical protein [Roseobacter sp. AzwK-3b]